MFNVEIYINADPDGDNVMVRMDTFKDENIQLTDTIQQARDPGNIFTAFTQNFTVPASKTNNKIFKHYYNPNIQDGYDARIRFDAIIKLNGADYKTGRIQLESVKMRLNKPYSYTLRFYGEMTELKEVLAETMLSGLDLSNFDHDYDEATVKDGLELGLGFTVADTPPLVRHVDADVIYPLISHTKRYVIDSGNTDGTRFYDTTDNNSLEYSQLKPAIKLNRIIEAIEAYTSSQGNAITFTTDFFGDAHFDDLYMWCNKDKGFIASAEDNTRVINANEFTFDAIDGADPFNSGNSFTLTDAPSLYSEFEMTLNPTTTGSTTTPWTLRVWDAITNETLYEEEGITGASPTIGTAGVITIKPTDVGTGYAREYVLMITIVVPGAVTSVGFAPEFAKKTYSPPSSYPTATTTVTGTFTFPAWTTASEINMSYVMPNQKVMDFMSGVFKMFNLVAYKKPDGTTYVDTLDQFYASGTERDITKYIDISDSEIKPVPIWDYLSFKYGDDDTKLKQKREELIGERFGDKDYRIGNGVKFGGGSYDIELPFSHLLFERLIDLVDGVSHTPHLFGWFVNDDDDPMSDGGKPLIFYNNGTQVTISPLQIEWDTTTDSTAYMRAGNTYDTGTLTLNFNAELSEWELGTWTNSLFETYYKNYVTSTYNEYARIVNVDAYLPMSFIMNYSLADVLIIHNQKYRINSITIDLIDGKSSLELITLSE